MCVAFKKQKKTEKNVINMVKAYNYFFDFSSKDLNISHDNGVFMSVKAGGELKLKLKILNVFLIYFIFVHVEMHKCHANLFRLVF